MSILRPLSEAEFLAYAQTENQSYADEKVRSGEWAPADALALARQSFAG